MLIILEGIDGAGKSTLARQLTEVLARSGTVTNIHRGPPTQHPLDEYLTPLLDYRPGTGQHWILDRWHVGERVYPQLRGRETQFDDVMWWYVNRYVQRLGGVTVYCHRSTAGLEQTYRERGEPELLAEVEDARKLFGRASEEALGEQLDYSFELPQSVEHIIRVAESCESYAAPLARYVTYVGPKFPSYLLLGEIRHKVDRTEQIVTRTDRRPAFVPHRSTSGHWLLESILADPELAGGVGLANARDVDDVYALWRDLGRPKTVTLGRQAHREVVTYADMRHGQVPHPQYMRRFFNRNRAEYLSLVTAALRTNGDYSRWQRSSLDGTAPRFTPRSSTSFGAPALAAPVATVPPTT